LFRRERGIDSVIEEGDSTHREILIRTRRESRRETGDIVKVEVLEHPTSGATRSNAWCRRGPTRPSTSIETTFSMLAHGIPYGSGRSTRSRECVRFPPA